MAAISNNFIQRLSGSYDRLKQCKLVSEKKSTYSTCDEFNAICNGCSPISIEEQAVVATIRNISRASPSGGVFSTPGLQYFSIVVGGLVLAENLGISDIAFVPYSTNESFSKCTPKKKYNKPADGDVPDAGKKKIMGRHTREQDDTPSTDVEDYEEEYPHVSFAPNSGKRMPPPRSTREEPVSKTIPRPSSGKGAAAWREYSVSNNANTAQHSARSAPPPTRSVPSTRDAPSTRSVMPPKSIKFVPASDNEPKPEKVDAAAKPDAGASPDAKPDLATKTTKRPPKTAPKKRAAPMMLMAEFAKLKDDILTIAMSEDTATVTDDAVKDGAGSNAADSNAAGNNAAAEKSQQQKYDEAMANSPAVVEALSKSWADMEDDTGSEVSKK